MVHVYAYQLLTHGADEQSGNHGGVHAAGEGQEDLFLSDLRAQGLYLLVNIGLGHLGGGNADHLVGASFQSHKFTS